MSHRQLVTLKVYNLQGQEVATLVNGPQEPGTYKVHFAAGNLPGCVYLLRMTTGAFCGHAVGYGATVRIWVSGETS